MSFQDLKTDLDAHDEDRGLYHTIAPNGCACVSAALIRGSASLRSGSGLFYWIFPGPLAHFSHSTIRGVGIVAPAIIILALIVTISLAVGIVSEKLMPAVSGIQSCAKTRSPLTPLVRQRGFLCQQLPKSSLS